MTFPTWQRWGPLTGALATYGKRVKARQRGMDLP